MIPYSYEMVDMGGIDLAEANGTVVEGLYNRIREALNACGDVILRNWKFAGIEIAPSAVTTITVEGSILINGIIQVTELDTITVLGIDPPLLPVIPLLATENGVYEITPPQSGYNPVTVAVNLVLEPLSVYSNGTYVPHEGADGFSEVTVSVDSVTEWHAINSAGSVGFGSDSFTIMSVPQLNSAIESAMQKGWNARLSNYYNSENLIGAYAGFYADSIVPIETVRVYLGRYSSQNNTLIVTIEYLNSSSEWVELEDLEITPTLSYPLNYFTIDTSQLQMRGLRWIHKKEPKKASGNNICFFGFSILKGE